MTTYVILPSNLFVLGMYLYLSVVQQENEMQRYHFGV